MRILVVGCGYVGFPLAVELVRLGHQVWGLRRSSNSDDELQQAGISPLHADLTRPETLVSLPNSYDWVVNCVASGGGGVAEYRELYLQGMKNLVRWLAGSGGKLSRIVYTSSTGVYGQHDGSTVDESSPTEPQSETAQVLVETEQALLAAGRDQSFSAIILRAAGIYGPERGYLLKQFLRGEARIEGDGSRALNMIHRDDLIAAIIAAVERGRPGAVYNACDDEPVSQLGFFTWLAGELNRPLPPMVPSDAALPRKRGLTNKRISNRKLRSQLGVKLRFPNFRLGYRAEMLRTGILPGKS